MGRSRPVYQYNREGSLVQKFESIKEASEATGVPHTTIRNFANSLTPKGTGTRRWTWNSEHIWSYTEDVELEVVEKVLSDLRLAYQFNDKGEVVHVYSGVREVAEALGEKYGTVKKRFRVHGTFRVGEHEYSLSLDRPRRLVKGRRLPPIAIRGRRVKDGEIVSFPSIYEAARSLGICRRSIEFALQGKSKVAGGYTWERQG